jgi:pimeloyl-ACP methyl ester carboxylesterase
METLRSADGTTIAFERTGSGPPLVIVGGALSDRKGAADLAAHLADGLTVVTFDRRGRGDSTDTQPYAPEREIEDIEALIRAVGGSAFVFGHSSGAALSLRAAEARLPIERLAVYEPPFIVDDAREPIPDDHVRHVDELLAAGRRGDAIESFMVVGVQVPAEVVAGMRGSPAWPAMESMAHTLAYDYRVLDDAMAGSPVPLERFATLAIPTLVLDGGASPDWIRNAARTLAGIIPGAEHKTLAGQAHGPADDILVPILKAFFA